MKQIDHLKSWLLAANQFTLGEKTLPVVVNTDRPEIYKIIAPSVLVQLNGNYVHRGTLVKYKGLDIDLPVKEDGLLDWPKLNKDELKVVMTSLRAGKVGELSSPQESLMPESVDKSEPEMVEPEVTPEVEPEVTPEVEPEVTPEVEPEVNIELTSMTKKDLISFADANGIEVDKSSSKTSLLETIESALTK